MTKWHKIPFSRISQEMKAITIQTQEFMNDYRKLPKVHRSIDAFENLKKKIAQLKKGNKQRWEFNRELFAKENEIFYHVAAEKRSDVGRRIQKKDRPPSEVIDTLFVQRPKWEFD